MSQGNVSDLTSTVSSVTDVDGSDHVNNNFTHVENPKGQRCIHCASSWKHLTATTMKAHLSNVKFSKEYKIKLCPRVPPSVSAAMVSKLQEVEGKKGKKRCFDERVNEEMSYELAEIAKKHKGPIIQCMDKAAWTLADQKVANYVYVTRQSFNSCDSLAYREAFSAVANAGPGYVPPSRNVIETRLLDEKYAIVQAANAKRLDRHSERGEGMTITSDGCTIHRRPLTNYIAKWPGEPGILLKYEDATQLYQEDGEKNAETVFDSLVEVIEEVGPSNVTAVVMDNAPTMVAAMALLMIRCAFLFCIGCLAHKVNTLVKHIIKDDDMEEVRDLVEKTKKIVHHFNEKHKPRALLEAYQLEHLLACLGFIVPADTRFGLYLLMLHRVYRLKAALQACVLGKEHIRFCEDGTIEDDEVVEIIKDDAYWDEMLKFLTLLLPLLRLTRLAELNREVIGKFYPATLAVKEHLEAEHGLLPYGSKIRDKFLAKAVVGEWLQDVHLAAYVLDPEYWDVDHLSMPEVMGAFARAIDKVFFHKTPPAEGWFARVMGQLRSFKDKTGHFARACAPNAAKSMLPSAFFETYGVEAMELKYMAKRLFYISISNDAAELNWKHHKDNSTKMRARLHADKVHKLISIQSAATLRENILRDEKLQALKWTLDDEVCKLSKEVEDSRDRIVANFLNYKEDWEDEKIRTKNRAHEGLLNDKYQHVYLYDAENDELRRIVHVEWCTAHRPPRYAVVTQLVNPPGDEDEDLMPYLINESLYECILSAPAPYNQQRRLISK